MQSDGDGNNGDRIYHEHCGELSGASGKQLNRPPIEPNSTQFNVKARAGISLSRPRQLPEASWCNSQSEPPSSSCSSLAAAVGEEPEYTFGEESTSAPSSSSCYNDASSRGGHFSVAKLLSTARNSPLPLAKRLALDYYIKQNIVGSGATGECGCCFQHNTLDTQNLLLELDDCYQRIYSKQRACIKSGDSLDDCLASSSPSSRSESESGHEEPREVGAEGMVHDGVFWKTQQQRKQRRDKRPREREKKPESLFIDDQNKPDQHWKPAEKDDLFSTTNGFDYPANRLIQLSAAKFCNTKPAPQAAQNVTESSSAANSKPRQQENDNQPREPVDHDNSGSSSSDEEEEERGSALVSSVCDSTSGEHSDLNSRWLANLNQLAFAAGAPPSSASTSAWELVKFDSNLSEASGPTKRNLPQSHCSLTDNDDEDYEDNSTLSRNSAYQELSSLPRRRGRAIIRTTRSLLDDCRDNNNILNKNNEERKRNSIRESRLRAPASRSRSFSGGCLRRKRRLSLGEIHCLNNNVAPSSSMRAVRDIAKVSVPSLSSVQYLPDRMDRLKSQSYTPGGQAVGAGNAAAAASSRSRRSPRLRLSPVPFKSPPSPSTQIEDGLKVCSMEHFEKHIGNIKDNQIEAQKMLFTAWINHNCPNLIQHDLVDELRDGIKLIKLLASLTKDKKLTRHYERLSRDQRSQINRIIMTPNSRLRHLSNVSIAIDYLRENLNMKLINLNPMDVVSGKANVVLGLCWSIILNFQLEQNFLRYLEESCGGESYSRLATAGNSSSLEVGGAGCDNDSLLSVSISTRSTSRNSNYADELLSRSDACCSSLLGASSPEHQNHPTSTSGEFYIEERKLLEHINKRFNFKLNNLNSNLLDGQALLELINRLIEKPEEQLLVNSRGRAWSEMNQQQRLEHCFNLANTYLNVPRLFSAAELSRQLAAGCTSKPLLVYLSMLLSSDQIVEKPAPPPAPFPANDFAEQLLTEALLVVQQMLATEAKELQEQQLARAPASVSASAPCNQPDAAPAGVIPNIVISDPSQAREPEAPADSRPAAPALEFELELESKEVCSAEVLDNSPTVVQKQEKPMEWAEPEKEAAIMKSGPQSKQKGNQKRRPAGNGRNANRKQAVRSKRREKFAETKAKAKAEAEGEYAKETSFMVIIWRKLIRAYNASFSLNIVLLVCLAGICVMPLVQNREACCDELGDIPTIDFQHDKPI